MIHAKRAYLAGPMTGYPDYNAAGFAAAGEWVRAQDWEPVSPHDTDPSHGGDCPPGEKHKGHPNACWYGAGVRVLLGCDLIVLLPGWAESTGARIELAVANERGMPVEHWAPVPPCAVTSAVEARRPGRVVPHTTVRLP